MGWEFTPVRDGEKRPFTTDWVNVSMSAEEAEEWAVAGHNLAVKTGTASNLVVLDFDVQKDSQGRALESSKDVHSRIDGLKLPPTVMASTPSGGFHLYFRRPHGIRISNSAGKLGRHIDVRGESGCVVAVGSIMPNGGTYRWVDGHSPEAMEMAVLPPPLVRGLQVGTGRAGDAGALQGAGRGCRTVPPD